ncbi:glycosylase [Larkinella soli]|uniref:glycosylase n=1 Tax=Larkinella soli TaxID=1770527 RepID=UPI0019CFCEE6|nr:glycosylase [Larkinella soli]
MKTALSFVLACGLLSGFTGRSSLFLPKGEIQDGLPGAFPRELVQFEPAGKAPVFAGTGIDTWDEKIRERGYILREGSTWHLWYTGYRNEKNAVLHLGYATSPDGIRWTRYAQNPVHDQGWVEDMCVVKSGNTYYMFAEGKDDIAQLLTSTDRVRWTEKGPLDIRYRDGKPLSEGPRGTPAVWKEGNTWYLFYERRDEAIWVATSRDLSTWTNVQDEPVLKAGPEPYDRYGVAMNQVIKHKGLYYGYYHATAFSDWREWSTNVAVSKDLIHWTKYERNPIIGDDKSSGILVHDGTRYRMYTMHPAVYLFYPKP